MTKQMVWQWTPENQRLKYAGGHLHKSRKLWMIDSLDLVWLTGRTDQNPKKRHKSPSAQSSHKQGFGLQLRPASFWGFLPQKAAVIMNAVCMARSEDHLQKMLLQGSQRRKDVTIIEAQTKAFMLSAQRDYSLWPSRPLTARRQETPLIRTPDCSCN